MKYFADDTAAVKRSGVHHPLEIQVTKKTFNVLTEVVMSWLQFLLTIYLFLLDLVTDAFKSLLLTKICKRIQDAKYQQKAIDIEIESFSHHEKTKKTVILINKREVSMNKSISKT